MLIPIAAMLGGLAGLLIGFPTFRLRGHYFALAMLAYPLAMLYVFEWLGFQEVTLPMKREEAAAYMQFADPPHLHAAGAGDDVADPAHHPRGRALALRHGAARDQAERGRRRSRRHRHAGLEAARDHALSGAIAGAIGGFYAVVLLVVTPHSVFGMLVSAQALTVTMFGGVGTVWGPVIGSVILIPLAETLHAELARASPASRA